MHQNIALLRNHFRDKDLSNIKLSINLRNHYWDQIIRMIILLRVIKLLIPVEYMGYHVEYTYLVKVVLLTEPELFIGPPIKMDDIWFEGVEFLFGEYRTSNN